MVRNPIVCGKFYPENKEDLIKLIDSLKPKESAKISARGIILPHAGYVYSGKVAITTVSKVITKKTVIILGTNHSGFGKNFALWPKGKWKTPLGDVPVNEELAAMILNQGTHVQEDYLAHQSEHSIEVELPILQYFLGQFNFVPISCKVSTLQAYQDAAQQIYRAVKNINENILFVASTDLSHYEPEAKARKKDRIAIESIINLDAEDLFKKVQKENITMCGIAPVAVFIACMKEMKVNKVRITLYQTSGDTSGDYESVVGYAGMIC